MEVKIDGGEADGDSDDGEDYGEPLLEVKDPYVLRPLPLLIGSQEFHSNPTVGLYDAPSGESLISERSVSQESVH